MAILAKSLAIPQNQLWEKITIPGTAERIYWADRVAYFMLSSAQKFSFFYHMRNV